MHENSNLFYTHEQWKALLMRSLYYSEHLTPAGPSLCITTDTHLVALSPVDRGQSAARIMQRITERLTPTTIKKKDYYVPGMPLLLIGTPFQLTVWKMVLSIPSGTTTTYQIVADSIGKPTAVRAVANAVGANPITYFVPCHRILRSDGSIGGYYWGLEMKRSLLKREITR